MKRSAHHKTFGVLNSLRVEEKRRHGTFAWKNISEARARKAAEIMFDRAGVPMHIRRQYWTEFEKMKRVLTPVGKRARQSLAKGARVMPKPAKLLTDDEMREQYGELYAASPKNPLNRKNVPENVWPLLPYAEFWGIEEQSPIDYEELVSYATPSIRKNLWTAVESLVDELDDWLAGDEAESENPTKEYVSFSILRMAADMAESGEDDPIEVPKSLRRPRSPKGAKPPKRRPRKRD